MLFVQIKDRITFDNLGNPDYREAWLLDLRESEEPLQCVCVLFQMPEKTYRRSQYLKKG
jgi:hypothetical protein